jgi:ABC-2 type transport system permease protein
VAEPLALYVRLVSARVRAQWQYRTSFVLDVLGVFLVTFLDFLAILVIFHNVPELGGWSVQEVALLYGISGLAFSLTRLALGQLDVLPQLIRDGNFDLVLIRPRRSLLQVIASDFHLRNVGRVVQAASVLVYAVIAVDIVWTPDRVAMVVVAVLAGAAIFAAVWVAAICIVFWAVEGRESTSAFTDAGGFLSQYPIDVYASWLQRLVTVVLPMAFVAYFPASYILDKPDPLGVPSWVPFASPAVALVAAIVAAYVWRFAIRHYRSAGG